MAFIQMSTSPADVSVTRYEDHADQTRVSIRLTGVSASLCMTLAEAEALRDELSAIIEPTDTTKISEVA